MAADDVPDLTTPRFQESGVEAAEHRRLARGTVLVSRFELGEKLGEGGMGHVFAAFDRERKERVAIKFLGRLTPQSIAQMKREFRSACELVHPNLVRLHELFSDGVEWFFSMELVEGAMLGKLAPDAPRGGIPRLRSILIQLAQALAALHAVNTIHGDLKPSNFLVAPPDDRVVLLDFGLSRPLGLAPQLEIAGTPAYMAPEQAMGDVLTEAADWYSFGVVLYEALTGELPLRRPSSTRLQGAPRDLAEICLRLLALRPADRPSAADVLAALGSGGSDPGRYATLPPPSRRPSLFGRTAELGVLRGALARTAHGAPALVLVHGLSGIGKTALVEHFVAHARAESATVFAGKCRERESMGYKAVDGLIDDIVAFVDGATEEEIAALLPADTAALTILFPGLLSAPAMSRASERHLGSVEQAVVRQRAVEAFGELFRAIRRRGPLVVWIDDLQWSDRESALLLGRALGGPDPVPFLLVGSYRDDAAHLAPLLDALFGDSTVVLPAATEVAVRPLDDRDAERLALELLPAAVEDAASLAARIAEEAAGHPLFIAELSYASHASWAAPRPLGSLTELVSQRVAALPERARRLLETTAVAGTPLVQAVLRETQQLGPAEAQEAIDVLRANRLVRSTGLREDDTVDIHHDRIREIVVAGLGEEDRKRQHLALARAFEARTDAKPEVLATHYHAAGDVPRARRYFRLAADAAMRALAFEHAAALYERITLDKTSPRHEWRDAQLMRAAALAHAGQGPAAANVYLATAPSCLRGQALELRRLGAEQLLLSGHLGHGLGVIEQVLDETGLRRSRGGRRALLSIAAGRLIARARGLRHEPRSEDRIAREELVRVDAAWTIASSLSVVDFVRGAEFQTKHLLLALRAGEPRRVLRALTLEVSYVATRGVGSERRTARLLAIAERLARESGDPGAAGLLCLSRGIADYLQERLEDAVTHFEEALSVFTRRSSGAVWETLTAQRFLNASLFFLGRLRSLADTVPRLLADADGKGNIYASMCFRTAYSWPAWLSSGDVDEARRQLARAREEWPTTEYQLAHANMLIGDSLVDFYAGDRERPIARIREEWARIEASQILRIAILRVQLRQLRAAAAAVAANAEAAQGRLARARELRAEARKFAKLVASERVRRAAPLAALMHAALDRAEGDVEGARRRLREAAQAFEGQGLRLLAASATARLGALTPGPDGARLVEEGLSAFRTEGVIEPWRMIDMFAPGT
ncbi:MAG TPA: protein kinase [Polyangiaceae bacterium]|nr:protein kinase [Polyangiaceae bacterium]